MPAKDDRVFLFLQGPPSSYARRLARELEHNGYRALRINLCAGDAVCWLGRSAVSYRGSLDDWADYLEAFIRREGVTDIIYYADRVPYHRIAAALARKLGIRAITYEFGYLRPDWLTLEYNGMSAHSHFPNDPETIKSLAEGLDLPDLHTRYAYPFRNEAFHEVLCTLSTYFLWFLYPRYSADRYYDPLMHYFSFLRAQMRSGRGNRRAHKLNERLAVREIPFFLVPLQVQNDYQLRANSLYNHQGEMIEEVVRSFAANAPNDTHLVFKLHPLDPGLENFPKIVREAARAADVKHRVHVNEGGTLGTLLRITKGAVLINSTVGVTALNLKVPVKVLGAALYDIKGLTHDGPLDTFWTSPHQPEPELRDAFLRVLAATIQVRGNFYTREGRAVSIPVMAQRLIEGSINQPGAFIDPPPRLAEAHARGLPYCDYDNLLAPARIIAPLGAKGRAAPLAGSKRGAGGSKM